MELHQIRYFLAAADTLNFTRAAERCGVSQPSLTRAIQKLEEELGGPLFRREGRRTHLTQLGRMVRPRLHQALSLTELARSEAIDFAQMMTGTLTVGCMCTIAPENLISVVDHVTQRVPHLRLQLREGSGARMLEALLAGNLDIALLGLPDYPETIEAHPLYSEGYGVAFAAGHRFEAKDAVAVRDLLGERYLRRNNCEYLDHFEKLRGDWPFDLDVRYESDHETWIQALIVAGLGCAVMPEGIARHPELQTRPLIEPEIRRTISVATVRGRRHVPMVDAFLRLCRSIDWGMPAA